MIIKGIRKTDMLVYIILLFTFIVLQVVSILKKENFVSDDIFVVSELMMILSFITIICLIAFELKIIYVDNKGIGYKILFVKIYQSWANINYIQEHIVVTEGRLTSETRSIICSTIPIALVKRLDNENKYFNAVSSVWVWKNIGKVFEIILLNISPDQYEEFWSYVPERLKKDSQKRGLYSKENCC